MSHRRNDFYFTGLDQYPASYKPSWKPIDEDQLMEGFLGEGLIPHAVSTQRVISPAGNH
ncbi:hypothetical protein DPMN_094725 [Dreissena polymorpha]|uniref:Uncharacterized protein n=1 Tax=Dreissena polymorpha TaxID=45954 RepID=A0A9D4R275_DREPO|nr:hypothetical protein DPMN_094725 [Dreissena polymorpha]